MNHHLDPAVLVDLFEGVPVDAVHRQHLSQCADCEREFERLVEVGRLVGELSDDEAACAAAPGFDDESESRGARVSASVSRSIGFDIDLGSPSSHGVDPGGVTETTPTTVAVGGWAQRHRGWLWLAASFALLWLGSTLFQSQTRFDSDSQSVTTESLFFETSLLPPADEDDEFLFLESLSEAIAAGSDEAFVVRDRWFGLTSGDWSTGLASMELLELEQDEQEALVTALSRGEGRLDGGTDQVVGPSGSDDL